jgi:hypothetical protein
MGLIEMKIRMQAIPLSIEEVDGFYGFASLEIVSFRLGSCVREMCGQSV